MKTKNYPHTKMIKANLFKAIKTGDVAYLNNYEIKWIRPKIVS